MDQQHAYVLTDLGYGDSGKGTTTHWLSDKTAAHTVIRTGGPQAYHHVVTASGVEHTFRQFGSGTFTGARTHLSGHMVIEPYAILNEGRALESLGVNDAFDRLTIDENALVITPYHRIANRLNEYARGKNRHGTVGLGVGETVMDSKVSEELTVRARDIGTPYLAYKLNAIRQHKVDVLSPIIERLDDLPPGAANEVALLQNPKIVEQAIDEFCLMGEKVRIVDESYLEEILTLKGTVIFEPSQGVLLDPRYGWHPHTTQVKTTNGDAIAMLSKYGYTGTIRRWGILRAYMTRHGAGPFVSEDEFLTRQLPDKINGENEWQGGFRVGHLDLVALRYAIAVCEGPSAFDGLSVTCIDRLKNLPQWEVATAYEGDAPDTFFAHEDGKITDIKAMPNSRELDLVYQQRLGQYLQTLTPSLQTLEASNSSIDWIGEQLGVKVKLRSYGPTEADKCEA